MKKRKAEISVGPKDQGKRIDLLVAERYPEESRTRIQKLISEKMILVNQKATKPGYKLKAKDRITIQVPPPEELEAEPQDIPLNIVYQDKDLLVINKEAGMVVHPAPGNYDKTLVNALLYHCKDLSGIQGVLRPGIVHRLDKGTSGLLVVAKNDFAHNHLSGQLKKREIDREYHALTWGNLGLDRGIIEAPIGRALTDRKRMKVTAVRGRQAVTEYEVLERFELCDLLRIKLQTGRTHQIRVHLSFAGHPVLGDPDYGGRQKWIRGISPAHRNFCSYLLKLIDRQALHAKKLGFAHPRTEKYMEFETELPQDFTDLLKELRKQKSHSSS
jgi:23S rRNA pseudouridine1911/1915/1917 synthase